MHNNNGGNMKEKIIDTFQNLIKYDTTSSPDSTAYPSTESQLFFADVLAGELSRIGMEDITIDKYGYVIGTLKGNIDAPTIGFIAHMDTSPDSKGYGIKPMIINDYDGGIIERDGVNLSPDEFPELKKYIGKTLICSDGNTLLGADDKAGCAAIITAFSHIINNPDIKRPTIKLAFTPDEEIGKGVDYFDVKKFGCDYAYTIDGGELGEVSFENFNAARVKIDITGKSVHPGSAKDLMVNAGLIATMFNNMLPIDEIPARTEGYQGFYHLTSISGNTESAKMDYIIRDFDKDKFEYRKNYIKELANKLNTKYGEDTIKLNIYDEYYNMVEVLNMHRPVVDRAIRAIEKAGIKPLVMPIRGGTDGARLSYMGLPCPNIFTGGHNFHGPYEFVCVESMIKAVEVIINIVSDEVAK